MTKDTFVYKLINNVNNKSYIGKSIHPNDRWLGHQYAAKIGKGFILHRAIRKYGSDIFELVILGGPYSNAEASDIERKLIRESSPELSYNIAEGGDGGKTMTKEQLDAQYAIKLNQYDEFISLFNDGKTIIQIKEYFNVSSNAVRSCAVRLNLSFKERRKLNATKKVVKKSIIPKKSSKIQWTETDPRRIQKSILMTNLNKSRGVSEEIKTKIVKMYFDKHMIAQEVADILEITKGSVRATVNAAYANMSDEERKLRKSIHGSKVRKGIRNTSHQTWKKRIAKVDQVV